jgi:hypothetical protein
MENEIRFDENRLRLIREFRAKVSNGQPASRKTLLAYAYLRGRSYESVERKINEDGFGVGRITFLQYLAHSIAWEIGLNKEPGYTSFNNPVYSWIDEKYKSELQEAAE